MKEIVEGVLVENKGYLKDCSPGFKENGEKTDFFDFFWFGESHLYEIAKA